MAQAPRRVRGIAQFLAVLILPRGNALHGLDGNAGIVPVIAHIPVPIAPGADRGDGALAKLPVGNQGHAAVLSVDHGFDVDVQQPVVDIPTGRFITQPRRERRELSRRAALALPHAQEVLSAAGGVQIGRIGRQEQRQCRRCLKQQLRAHGIVVDIVQVMARAHIAQHAVALADLRRQASGQALCQRAGHGTACLQILLVAHAHFAGQFGHEYRCAAEHMNRSARGVLAEQGALGATHDFHAFDVGKVKGC